MSVKSVRLAAATYFVLFALFVIWPVFVPFNRPLPLVLGLPFNMAAIAAWVAFGTVVLGALDLSEERHRTRRAASGPRGGRPEPEDGPVGDAGRAEGDRPPTDGLGPSRDTGA